ncbi:TetR/AcrR family transcriptional regulator [Mycoplasmatota bacterium WC44]
MPKSTFFTISEEKRNKIIKAAEDEFRRSTLDNAKVSNIVRDANISRGSFYQYFEDIDDVFFYIAESFTLYHEKVFLLLLIEVEGDVFKAIRENFINNFDHVTNRKRRELFRNIHISMNQKNTEAREIRFKLKDIIKEIVSTIKDYKKLDVLDKERLLFILKDIQWRTVHKSFKKHYNLEEALKELDTNLSIVKNGVE